MSYALHGSKVVGGAVTVVVMDDLMSSVNPTGQKLILGMVAVLGLFLAIHGLLTGIEAAVAAGTDSPTDAQPTD